MAVGLFSYKRKRDKKGKFAAGYRGKITIDGISKSALSSISSRNEHELYPLHKSMNPLFEEETVRDASLSIAMAFPDNDNYPQTYNPLFECITDCSPDTCVLDDEMLTGSVFETSMGSEAGRLFRQLSCEGLTKMRSTMNPLLARGAREKFSAETEEYENGERSDAFVVLDPLPGILEKTGSIAMGDAFISKIHENADSEGQNHIPSKYPVRVQFNPLLHTAD